MEKLKLWILVFILFCGCYNSYRMSMDVNTEGETQQGDFFESEDFLDVEGIEEEEEGIEFEKIPLCNPSLIVGFMNERCGNGIVEGGEECDDNNLLDGDGCTWECEEGDGSGGIAEESPLPLPRYCRIDNFKKIDEYLDEGNGYAAQFQISSPPISFWWNGTDYRLFYSIYNLSEDHYHIKLFSFDKNGENLRLLNEIDEDFTEFPQNTTSLLSVNRGDDFLEVFYRFDHRNYNGEKEYAIKYVAFDYNGRILRNPGILFYTYNGYAGIQLPLRFLNYNNKTLMTDDRVMLEGEYLTTIFLKRNYPLVEMCKIDMDNLDIGQYGVNKLTGGYINLFSTKNGILTIGIPYDGDIPSNFELKPIAKSFVPNWEKSLISVFPFDQYYYLFFIHNEWHHGPSQGDFPQYPYFAIVDLTGEPVKVPTKVFPQSYIRNVIEENCDLFNFDYGWAILMMENQFKAARGDETFGVLFSPFTYCYNSVGRTPFFFVFQTLDMEGRRVGEPCFLEIAEMIYSHNQSFSPVVAGMDWDGEGFGIITIAPGGIYFWRVLPE